MFSLWEFGFPFFRNLAGIGFLHYSRIASFFPNFDVEKWIEGVYTLSPTVNMSGKFVNAIGAIWQATGILIHSAIEINEIVISLFKHKLVKFGYLALVWKLFLKLLNVVNFVLVALGKGTRLFALFLKMDEGSYPSFQETGLLLVSCLVSNRARSRECVLFRDTICSRVQCVWDSLGDI